MQQQQQQQQEEERHTTTIIVEPEVELHEEELDEQTTMDFMGDSTLGTVMEEDENTAISSSHGSDELLKVTAGGLFGLVEKTPLPVKLVLMLLASVVGLIVFAILLMVAQGRELEMAKHGRVFARNTALIGTYIASVQNECELASTSIIIQDPGARELMFESRRLVDKNHAKLMSAKLDSIYGSELEPLLLFINETRDKSEELRSAVDNSNVGDMFAFLDFYDSWVDATATIASTASRLVNLDNTASSQAANFVNMLKAIGYQGKLKAYGLTMILQSQVIAGYYRAFVSARSSRDILLKLWRDSIHPQSVYHDYRANTLNATTITSQIEEWIESKNVGNPLNSQYSSTTWMDSITVILKQADNTQIVMSQRMIRDAESKFDKAVAIIIVYSVLIVFFALLAFVTSAVLSFSIISPWRRLNNIQEQAISKFVPKGFLKLLGYSRITDVNLGKFSEKELTMMEVEIADFENIAKNMSGEQMFRYLNNYLSHVGQVVRRHGGFIDKHFGHRFTAIFNDASRGVKSCVEMQAAMTAFNSTATIEEKVPAAFVNASVHTGTVLVGTVGENQRMSGVLMSHHVQINERLELLSKKFHTRLLTSKDSLDKCGKWIRQVKHRFLGKITVSNIAVKPGNGSSEKSGTLVVPVFEILHRSDSSASSKHATRDSFQKGVSEFECGSYAEAVEYFKEVAAKDPRDIPAKLYLNKAEQLLAQVRYISSSMKVKTVLNDPHLLQGFKLFCEQEYSTENLSLWLLIEDQYKTLMDRQAQINYASQLCSEFLDMRGGKTININEKLKKKVEDKLRHDPDNVDHTLFDEVQTELEFNMNDTLKRYHKSRLFNEYLLKSDKCLQKPAMLDEL